MKAHPATGPAGQPPACAVEQGPFGPDRPREPEIISGQAVACNRQSARSAQPGLASRAPIPKPSPEVGFVNQVSEPVYKMLSIGSTIPGSGLTDSLIGQYREVIAADYAYVFLGRNLRIGTAAPDKDFQLDC
jgi:hypothetical protein